MSIDPIKIKEKIISSEQYTTKLKWIIDNIDEEEFVSNFDLHTIAERSIGIIVQVIIDTCNHIVAKSTFGKIPSTYGECIQILAQNKVISAELQKNLILAIAMRNVIIHRYVDVDLIIIFHAIPKLLNDFADYTNQILQWIEKI